MFSRETCEKVIKYNKVFKKALILIFLIFLGLKFATPKKFNYEEFIERDDNITNLWIQATPDILIPCPEAEDALFETNVDNKYVSVHTCKVLTFQLVFGKKELTYEEANRRFNLDFFQKRRNKK